MDPACIKEHKGCGNCPNITYKVFKDGMEMDDNEGPADFFRAWSSAINVAAEMTKTSPVECVICGASCPRGKITCCDDHHEEYIQQMEIKFGFYKKVTDEETGVSYKVSIREIIEKGLKQKDLSNYPEWE